LTPDDGVVTGVGSKAPDCEPRSEVVRSIPGNFSIPYFKKINEASSVRAMAIRSDRRRDLVSMAGLF